ncbi:hypothetical protein NPIL_531391 [Nephila pilipes]|uniref:Uncharacterized protein n=1 Tax=Nephila pilipes TaxID=299642 RepID=A0A8X6MU46_NEPPI|nr:hypothetical protein NPIL_601 [Nephila pilipes]GFS99058.1 hypothetical protein NPIL_50461 [Nephila pilipes]GFT37790.1 hypothetical protein NPIL_508381 [Nephila pilipes]GFT51264.1 hypothetical protein NPIL_531391 [Nephila pilipes]
MYPKSFSCLNGDPNPSTTTPSELQEQQISSVIKSLCLDEGQSKTIENKAKLFIMKTKETFTAASRTLLKSPIGIIQGLLSPFAR